MSETPIKPPTEAGVKSVAEGHPSSRRIDAFLRKKYYLIERKHVKSFALGVALAATITGVGLWQVVREAIKNGLSATVAQTTTDQIVALGKLAEEAVTAARDSQTQAAEFSKATFDRMNSDAFVREHTEQGSLLFTRQSEGGWVFTEKGKNSSGNSWSRRVEFSKAFVGTPNVQAFLQGLQVAPQITPETMQKTKGGMYLTVVNADMKGFDLVVGYMALDEETGPVGVMAIGWTAVGKWFPR